MLRTYLFHIHTYIHTHCKHISQPPSPSSVSIGAEISLTRCGQRERGLLTNPRPRPERYSGAWTPHRSSSTMQIETRFRCEAYRPVMSGIFVSLAVLLGVIVVSTNAQDGAPQHAMCEAQISEYASTLPKVSNPAFQRKAWSSGCEHAAAAQADVDTCSATCASTAGCCRLDEGHISKCYSNSCSGGGCCAASRTICQRACTKYSLPSPSPPPPSPPPPSPPPPSSPPPLPSPPPPPFVPMVDQDIQCSLDVDCPSGFHCETSVNRRRIQRRSMQFGGLVSSGDGASSSPADNGAHTDMSSGDNSESAGGGRCRATLDLHVQ